MFIIAATCRICGHARNPKEFVINTTIGYCWQCYERHIRAMDILAGTRGFECGECRLNPHEALTDVVMRLYIKDGIYQCLCVPCGDKYEMKQRQMFAGTPYGHAKGLHTKV
jgi:hypothetical protein